MVCTAAAGYQCNYTDLPYSHSNQDFFMLLIEGTEPPFLLTSELIPTGGEAVGDLLGGEAAVSLYPAVLHRKVMLTCLWRESCAAFNHCRK